MERETKTIMAQELEQNRPTIRRDDAGRLTVLHENDWVYVRMRPCFPWSQVDRYLSLRDDDNREMAFIETLEGLDPESRAAVSAAIEEAQFAFEIVRIEDIDRDFELRIWKVETKQGRRIFTTKLEDWPRHMADGSIVIEDLAGDLYVVPDKDKLDRNSQKLLWAYVA